jgi:fatty acid kinase fatty acid binding subunit
VPVRLVDSLGTSLLTGLLVLKAAELAELATPPEEIAAELDRIRAQSGLLFTLDNFDRLIASGRVSKGRAWLGSLLRVKPVLGFSLEGHLVPVRKAFGRSRMIETLLDEMGSRIPDSAERVRFGIVHVACPEILDEVRERLVERYGEVEILTCPITPVLSTHLGLGAWGLAYMVED